MNIQEMAEKLNDLCIMCNFTDAYGDYIDAEPYYDAIEIAIKALETMQELKKRNITMVDLENYMQFEDECVKKGFTFTSLLEAREKQIPKKVIKLGQNEYYDYKCPSCGLPDKDCMNKSYCNCGQKLDRSEQE